MPTLIDYTYEYTQNFDPMESTPWITRISSFWTYTHEYKQIFLTYALY